jgi:hypothetical protein
MLTPSDTHPFRCAKVNVRPEVNMKKMTLVLLAAFPLFGAGEALPSVETVSGHFIDATGGKAAYEARHSLIEHATIDFAHYLRGCAR